MSQRKNKQETIIIIDYGAGNIRSAAKAFEHVVREESLPYEVKVSSHAQDVLSASHLVLPGQGAFGDCINALKNTEGMIEALEESVLKKGTKFLGICVGMQLLVDKGFEHGEHEGLGWIPGQVVPIKPTDKSMKIPHMGWNDVYVRNDDAQSLGQFVLRNTKSASQAGEDYYFVHSFMVECKEERDVLAHVDYGGKVTAAVGRDNYVGVQFHPEKSQKAGLGLISRFLHWTP